MKKTPSKLGPLARSLLFVAGWLSLALGALGMLLPLLPTTPFLLLAAACFARSSPRLHSWLLQNRYFGPLLRQWERNRTVTAGVKAKAQLVGCVTFLVSIALVDMLALRLMLLLLGCALFVFLGRLPVSEAQNANPATGSRAPAATPGKGPG